MSKDAEIGHVVAIDSAEITVRLAHDFLGMTRSTYEGPRDVGRINSYVVIPMGTYRLVAIVTRVVMASDVDEPDPVRPEKPQRMLKATLVGTIDRNGFSSGIASFPVLDSAVLLAGESDLNHIFDRRAPPAESRFRIPLGESTLFPGFDVRLDPDVFFGKHAAVLGSTGAGKSCTIAAVIQAVLQHDAVKTPHFVILDTNGEYRAAFQRRDGGDWTDIGRHRTLFIPSDATNDAEHLVIPYWFLDADDFARLFRASQGVQRPVLLEALRLARNDVAPLGQVTLLRDDLLRELNRVLALANKDEKTSKDILSIADGMLRYSTDAALSGAWDALKGASAVLQKDRFTKAASDLRDLAAKYIDKGTYPMTIPADGRKAFKAIVDPLIADLTGLVIGEKGSGGDISADSPAYFEKNAFRARHLEQVLRSDEAGGARARDYSGTMLLRIDRLLRDRRYEFLLGPIGSQLPSGTHLLATFVRDLLGLPSADGTALSTVADVPKGTYPFYDRQRAKTTGSSVVIVDLSFLAAEVLENVTAILGRIILEFLQRLGEASIDEDRAALPVVLVLEEAQNYIHERRPQETEDSVSRLVFERIAREGRKFGLSLLIASQRPSEVSRTVLSQCSTFVVHRLQSPDDLRYFKDVVPITFARLVDQVPALVPQTALVVGEAVLAPALVKIREAAPPPRSRNPRFYQHWIEPLPELPVETVAAQWSETPAPKATQP